MVSTLVSVLIISSIGAALALVLVLGALYATRSILLAPWLVARIEGYASAELGVELEIERLEGERSEVSRKVEEFGREASSLEGDARALAERRDQLLSRVKGWELSARDEDQRADEMDAEATGAPIVDPRGHRDLIDGIEVEIFDLRIDELEA